MMKLNLSNRWVIALLAGAASFLAGLLLYQQVRALKQRLEAYAGGRSALFGPYDTAVVGDSIAWGGRWQRLCPGRRFANYAEGGKSALEIVLRLPQFKETSARRVFMLMGLSDSWQGRTVDAIVADFRTIAKTMQEGGRQVTIVSVLLPERAKAGMYFAGMDFSLTLIQSLNERLPVMAREIGARFVDVNATLAPSGELRSDFTYDGLHLTDEAYGVLARTANICG